MSASAASARSWSARPRRSPTFALERLQPRQQPFSGERRRDADRERAALAERSDRVHRIGKVRETFTQVAQSRRPGVGENQAAAAALEHGQANVVLQETNLMTDRGGCHVEFVRGHRQAEMTRCGLEGS
jgi:hypothetical protein